MGVSAVSPGRRFFSTSTTRTCRGTPKKHSTQNTQFACTLFLFLLPGARAQLFVFVLALRCHFCFCCCALYRVQRPCQFLKSLFKQWVIIFGRVSVTPYLLKVLPESHDLDRKCYREEQGVTTDSWFISLAQAFLRGIPRRCRRSQSDFRLIPSFCASSVSLIRSWFSSTKCWK